jgi:hypothetical protein
LFRDSEYIDAVLDIVKRNSSANVEVALIVLLKCGVDECLGRGRPREYWVHFVATALTAFCFFENYLFYHVVSGSKRGFLTFFVCCFFARRDLYQCKTVAELNSMPFSVQKMEIAAHYLLSV